jgi:hypothetical protein
MPTARQRLDEAKDLLNAGYMTQEEFDDLRREVVAELRKPSDGAADLVLYLRDHLRQFFPSVAPPDHLPGDPEVCACLV